MDRENMNRSIIVVAVMLAGCASPTVFRNPKRGQVAQCNATTPGIVPIIAQHEIDDCAAAYGHMG
jgi:hypothetical protein